MKVLAVLILSIITGCASVEEMQMAYTAQSAVVTAQSTIQSPPTLSIKCGDGEQSCKGLNVNYLDPRDRHKFVVPTVTNRNDVVQSSIKPLVTLGGYVAGAVAATRIMDDVMSAAGGNNRTTHNTTSVIGDGNDTNATTSMSSNDGNASTADNNQDNDTALTDVSNDKSTTDRHDFVTNSDLNNDKSTTDSNDSVSEPTVVNQPDPTIVNPVVVNQPDPIIVETNNGN